MPLIHHILDLNVASDDSDAKAARKGNRLNALSKTMKVFQSHYDGVEWLTSVLQKALQSSNHDQKGRGEFSKPGGLGNPPVPYLQIAFTVDFSLNRSRYAQASDIPDYLEELLQDNSTQKEDEANCTDPWSIFEKADAASVLELAEEDWLSTDEAYNGSTLTQSSFETITGDAALSAAHGSSLDFMLAGNSGFTPDGS